MLLEVLSYLSLNPSTAPAPGGDAPQWWETWAGILAIPVAILAIPAAWLLIKKTNLDSRKTELEIQEKENALRAAATAAPGGPEQVRIAQLLTAPLIESRRVQEIILRFIMLYLAIVAWGFVSDVFSSFTNTLSAFTQGGGSPAGMYLPGAAIVAISIGLVVIGALPNVGYYLIVLGIGGPLVADIFRHLGSPLPRYLRFVEAPSRRTFFWVGIVVLVVSVVARSPILTNLYYFF